MLLNRAQTAARQPAKRAWPGREQRKAEQAVHKPAQKQADLFLALEKVVLLVKAQARKLEMDRHKGRVRSQGLVSLKPGMMILWPDNCERRPRKKLIRN
jgi:hypothetical protein